MNNQLKKLDFGPKKHPFLDLLKKLGLSQDLVAQQLGITTSRLAHYLHLRAPFPKHLERAVERIICHKANVERIDELFA